MFIDFQITPKCNYHLINIQANFLYIFPGSEVIICHSIKCPHRWTYILLKLVRFETIPEIYISQPNPIIPCSEWSLWVDSIESLLPEGQSQTKAGFGGVRGARLILSTVSTVCQVLGFMLYIHYLIWSPRGMIFGSSTI